jgi:hypothetical protein
MKNLVLFLFVFISLRSFADIAPDSKEYAPISRCDIIENAETYEAKAISKHPSGATNEYSVKNNMCLNAGYKFSEFYIKVNGKYLTNLPSKLGRTFDYLKRPTTTVAIKRVFKLDPGTTKEPVMTLKLVSEKEYQTTAPKFEYASF